MNEIIIISIPIFLILLTLEAYVSYKKKKNFYKLKDSLGNLGTGIINQLIEVFTKAALILLYIYVYEHFAIGLKLWSDNFLTLHGFVSWVIVFILTDFIYYFFHRHSHEINLFWAAHMVHHSSEEYNFSVALRQSGISGVLNWVYALVLALMGVPAHMYFICYGLNLIYQFFIHTRFVGKLGFLEKILNTPSHHRVHHARQSKYLDSNYSGIFIIWDRLFGTFIEEEEEPRYGVYPRFQSYDPVRANLMPYSELYYYVKKAKGWDKGRVLFSGPLWLYDHFKKDQKLNVLENKIAADIPSFLLFIFALAFGVIILFVPALTLAVKAGIMLIVFSLLTMMGKRLDRQA